MTETTTELKSTDRDASGRYLPGHKGTGGNPLHRRAAQIRALIREVSGENGMRAVVGQIVRQALEGCVASQKMLLDRVYGKPTESVEVSGDFVVAREVWLTERAAFYKDAEVRHNIEEHLEQLRADDESGEPGDGS